MSDILLNILTVLFCLIFVSLVVLFVLGLFAPCEWGNHHGDHFCFKCGKELYSVCPECDHKQRGDFCSNCGFDFSLVD